MRILRHPLTIAGLVIASACSSSGGAASTPGARPAPSEDRNLLTQDELQRTAGSDLFDAIRILRPQWLLVYLDGVRYGDATSLRQISISVVQEVRFLSPSEAQGRYGTQDLHGVIAVTTRHR